ncbi:RluA family pseudouridine synthase [Desulfococcus sp.]|uniref:RluA family pseudouridine synthase n=1 Tax=Desulfococcus sp. TaxID=2025834 RepID=UPI003D127099
MIDTVDEYRIIVDDQSAGLRLDAFLGTILPDCSRSYAAQLIRTGRITLFQRKAKPSHRLRPGDEILARIPPPEPAHIPPEPIPLDIIYQDDFLIVLNKPAGMVVHPAPGHSSGTLVNALLHHCPDLPGIGGEVRPGIVHRLDKDTTGLLVVAKTADAHTDLSAQFKSRRVGKKYLVLVHDHMATDSGSIDRPIARHPSNRKKMAVTMGSGRHALTRWRRLEHLAEASLLEVDLLTGRTHQIRVHFSAIHHPVIGDPIYSSSNWGNHSPKVRRLIQPVRRQMLHALEIRFKHPESGADICFSAPPPPDMLELICALRKAYTDVSS